MKNSIWITGASGRIGKELVKRLKANTENRVVATDKDVDITDSKAVMSAAEIYRPDVIINCSSISDVKFCEENMIEAFKVNALGARNLANAARKVNAKIVQLSTDDVFASNGDIRLTEFDTPNPVSVYGKSKLAGENYVKELNPKHLIIRSSWVYGFGTSHFLSYIREKVAANESFTVPEYLISTPTCADTLADFICTIIEKSEYGIFHASSEGSCTRLEFARSVLEGLGADPNLAVPEKSEDGTVSSTLLENLMLKMTGLYEMPAWKEDLDKYLKNNK
ncbi:MAG: NAD(P)-dependent oxidoreductase [Saccharofermentans sp.]|nr:NAD(P)-dependent oxidoreductase [Saccharofermentans sp.]